MPEKRNIRVWGSIIMMVFVLLACTRYERQVVPFKMPSAYPNVQEAADAQIAARSYDDSKEAGDAFGFDP